MAGKLQDKVAFITGASQGQGAAVARLFAEEGAKVVLTDIADAAGEKVAAEIARSGGDACYYHLDVAEEGQWREVLEKVKKRHATLTLRFAEVSSEVSVALRHAAICFRAGASDADRSSP